MVKRSTSFCSQKDNLKITTCLWLSTMCLFQISSQEPVAVREVTEPMELGEGPHWDSDAQALYFVSVFQNSIHKYVPATGLTTSTKLDGQPGFIVSVEGVPDQFVVGLECKFVVLQWDGQDGSSVEVVKELGEVDQDVELKMRINDGKVDPRGRLFAGTLSYDVTQFTNVGSLYRVEGENITKIERGIQVSNGLSWDLSEKAFYYTDSYEYKIRRYDYDAETGEISNLSYVFDFKEQGIEGLPDGHTIDTDGNLWIAVFGAACVLQVDPRSGKILQKLPIPVKQVTSVTWGGPNLDILYVTSGSINFYGENKPPGGCTYEVTGLGAKGHPNRNFKL